MNTTKRPYLKDTFYGMRARCENPKSVDYKNYGGRGIKIHPDFTTYDAFRSWITENLGDRPPGYSLDRINNDGNYEPGNLRWASPQQQATNRRRRRSKKAIQCTKVGVTYDPKGRKKPYKAQIRINGVNKHLGYFRFEEAAAIAYDKVAKLANEEHGTGFVLNYQWADAA